MKDLNTRIKKLISIGQTEEALRILLDELGPNDNHEFVILANRFSEIQRKTRLGIISLQEENIELNQINNSILESTKKLVHQKQEKREDGYSILNSYDINFHSNTTKIVIAVCAVITVIITLISIINSGALKEKLHQQEGTKLSDIQYSEELSTEDYELSEKLDEGLGLDLEKCIGELLEEEISIVWSCIQGLIKNKEFERAAFILENAKGRTINQEKIRKFNSRLNDLDIIVKLDLDDAWGEFNDSLVVIKKNGMEGFANKKGEVIFNPIFESVNPQDFQPLVEVEEKGKIGFIDNSGRVVHPPRFNFANPQEFHPLISIEENQLIGFMDSLGRILHEPQFEEAMYEKENMIGVRKNGKWGFMDTRGILVIDCQFNSVEYFDNGKAKVRLNDSEYLIDKTGNKVK